MPLVNRNKRTGPDMVVRAKKVFIFLAWLFMFAFFLALSIARPRVPTMWDRFYGGDVLEQLWSGKFLTIAIYFMIPAGIISVIGLILNSRRHKRKNDKYSLSLIIFFSLSIVAIALYYIL